MTITQKCKACESTDIRTYTNGSTINLECRQCGHVDFR